MIVPGSMLAIDDGYGRLISATLCTDLQRERQLTVELSAFSGGLEARDYSSIAAADPRWVHPHPELG